MVRPSAASLFVVVAIGVVVTVGALAHRASGAAGESSSTLPSDVETFGFAPRGRVSDVALLEATRPFLLSLGNGDVRGVPPSISRLAAVRGLVARELERYPASFAPRIHLAGVVLTEELLEGDRPIPSLPNVGGLLLLDIDAAEVDLVRTIHHEVFHFADLADDGHLAPDPSWEALNAAGFAYGAGGRTLRASWAARPSPDLTGFVSGYATSGVEEDKAETFAFLVARPDAVRARLATDPVLAAKAREITRRVASLDDEAPKRLGL